MSANTGTGRAAFDAEARGRDAAEKAIQEKNRGKPINFDAARERELARVTIAEPSALFALRERERNAGTRA